MFRFDWKKASEKVRAAKVANPANLCPKKWDSNQTFATFARFAGGTQDFEPVPPALLPVPDWQFQGADDPRSRYLLLAGMSQTFGIKVGGDHSGPVVEPPEGMKPEILAAFNEGLADVRAVVLDVLTRGKGVAA